MTNGIELLHKRHDTELELMENLRVIVHKRARAEQHYAQELIKIQQTAKKAPLKGSLEDASLKTTYDVSRCSELTPYDECRSCAMYWFGRGIDSKTPRAGDRFRFLICVFTCML
jgi:hypothetical protein